MPGPGMKRGGPGGHRFQKPKNVKKTVLRLFGYLSKRKWLLILVVVMVLLSTLGMVSASYFIRVIVDDYLQPMLTAGPENADFGPLMHMLLRMAILFALSAAAAYGYARIMLILSQSTVNIIRRDLFDAMQDLPISYFDTHTHGELMSRYTNDVDTLRQLMSQSLPQLMISAITLLSVFCIMIYYSIWLALVVLCGVVVMFFTARYVSGHSSKYFLQQQITIAKTEGFMEEMMSGQKVIKVFCHEEGAKADFDKVNDELFENSEKANRYANILMPLLGNMGNVTYVVVALVGGALLLNGAPNLSLSGMALNISIVVPFLNMTKQFAGAIGQVSNQVNMVVMGLAGAHRIFALLDEEPETDDGYVTLVNARENADGTLEEYPERTNVWAWKHPHHDGTITYTRLRGDVRFYDVDFGYTPEKTVLHDISLYAKPGQKVAFVGSTGAGKTTITNLINRFYDIADGKIRYDGININKIKKADLRRSLGMVLQDTHLFTGTVMENIRYGRLDATDEEIVAAAKLVNAHDFITHMEHGYDSDVGEGGGQLSTGEKQLISFARAVLANPRIFVLDEATASIDTKTEALIQEAISTMLTGRTSFLIAHRLSTIRKADMILVVRAGKIIERGTHRELMALGGYYADLYNKQFETESAESVFSQ